MEDHTVTRKRTAMPGKEAGRDGGNQTHRRHEATRQHNHEVTTVSTRPNKHYHCN